MSRMHQQNNYGKKSLTHFQSMEYIRLPLMFTWGEEKENCIVYTYSCNEYCNNYFMQNILSYPFWLPKTKVDKKNKRRDALLL